MDGAAYTRGTVAAAASELSDESAHGTRTHQDALIYLCTEHNEQAFGIIEVAAKQLVHKRTQSALPSVRQGASTHFKSGLKLSTSYHTLGYNTKQALHTLNTVNTPGGTGTFPTPRRPTETDSTWLLLKMLESMLHTAHDRHEASTVRQTRSARTAEASTKRKRTRRKQRE